MTRTANRFPVGMLTLFFFVALSLPAANSSGQSSTTAEHAGFEQARKYFQAGEYKPATIVLKNLLQRDPDNLAARFLLGRIHLARGDGASAEKELLLARAAGADRNLIAVPLARTYLLQGKYDAVFDEVQVSGRPRPLKSELWSIRGEARLEQGDLEAADKAFANAARLQPGNASPVIGQAKAALRRGQFAAAEALADQATAIAPDDPKGWYIKAECRRLQRDFEAALGFYDRTLRLDPWHSGAHKGRAASLIDIDRSEEARVDINAALAVDPNDPHAIYLNALLLSRAGKDKQARAVLMSVLPILERTGQARLRSHAPSLLLLGIIHYSQQRHDEARLYLERYLLQVPHHPGARKMLGASLAFDNQPKRAIEVMLPALEWTPDDPELLSLLGSAYMRDKQYSTATRMFVRAAELDPNKAEIRTHLALSRLAAGDHQQALDDLNAAFSLNGESTRPGILLGLIQLKRGDYRSTLSTAHQLQRRAPDNPTGYNLAGGARLRMGKDKYARREFERALEIDAAYLPAQYNLAALDLRNGNVDAAKARYLKVRSMAPGEIVPMIALARISEQQGRNHEAIQWLEKVRATDRSDPDSRLRLVNHYLGTENTNSALAIARELQQMDGDNPTYLLALGKAHILAGDYANAGTLFRRIAGNSSVDAMQLERLARYQMQVDDVAGARDSLQQAVEMTPDFLPAQIALMGMEEDERGLEGALARAVQVRSKYPQSSLGDLLVGDALLAGGEPEKALIAYRAGELKQPRSALAIRIYTARREVGEGEQALKELTGWADSHPDDIAARRVLAAGYATIGRTGLAIALNQELLARIPNDAALINNLARLYGLSGDPRALEMAGKAYRLAPEQGATLDTLAWILAGRGDNEQALDLLREARLRAPEEPSVRYHLGVVLHALGQTDEAREELKGALHGGKRFGDEAEARVLLDQISAP